MLMNLYYYVKKNKIRNLFSNRLNIINFINKGFNNFKSCYDDRHTFFVSLTNDNIINAENQFRKIIDEIKIE